MVVGRINARSQGVGAEGFSGCERGDRMRQRKERIFDIIQIGNTGDWPSRSFDVAILVMILLNLMIAILQTFHVPDGINSWMGRLEFVTVVCFTVEYVLRVWTADLLYPEMKPAASRLKYVFSFSGLIDLLAFAPYWMPMFFPMGIVAFRMFRVVRILRLFQINAYSDALSAITDVLKSKKDQLFSSIFIILVLIMASSLCMYSLEHEAQPDVFQNAFSGIWWAVSTLLTVGYGDIYPITTAGRIFGIIITFLGVGMVAIPTGILSAGFVEKFSELKQGYYEKMELEMQFVRVRVIGDHPWIGKSVEKLRVPPGLILAVIERDHRAVMPHGDTIIQLGDDVLLAAEGYHEDLSIQIKEIVLKRQHPWVGEKIADIDISRQSLVVMVRRDDEIIIPDGDTVLQDNDEVFIAGRSKIKGGNILNV